MDAYLRAMVHALPDAVACVDGAGVVVGWNAGAAALFAVEEASAVGRALHEIVGVNVVDGARVRVVRGTDAVEVVAALTPHVHGAHTLVVFSTTPKPDPRDDLSPRLRQTLDALLAGRSEKQIASELGLSQHTVHDYVKVLYKRFGVASRAELLANVLRR